MDRREECKWKVSEWKKKQKEASKLMVEEIITGMRKECKNWIRLIKRNGKGRQKLDTQKDECTHI